MRNETLSRGSTCPDPTPLFMLLDRNTGTRRRARRRGFQREKVGGRMSTLEITPILDGLHDPVAV